MMKKYIISIVSSQFKNDPIGGGASAKAPTDILTIAKNCGYEEISIYDYNTYGFVRKIISLLYQFLLLLLRLKEPSVLFFQYPHINPKLMLIQLPLFKKHHLVAIIHDINSIRVDGYLSDTERKSLLYFDEIFVHTENMKSYFEEHLSRNITYHVIDCFPYIAKTNIVSRKNSKCVCFAGNLDKSLFLHEFLDQNQKLNIILYGITRSQDIFEKKATYLGKFMPDDISHIEGSWGLVWDGERVDCCGGNFGEYMKIIAPHKFSMYIVSELPLIVWKHSAMASLVERELIGITVEHLNDIAAALNGIDDITYNSFISNIKEYQKKVISGDVFQSYLLP